MLDQIPRAHTGDPEAGLQKDLFGDTHLFMPQVKKKVTQISLDDQLKLEKTRGRTGRCQDPNCDYPEEEANLNYYNGRWICDGCLEAEWDNEEFMEANRQDMIESGWMK